MIMADPKTLQTVLLPPSVLPSSVIPPHALGAPTAHPSETADDQTPIVLPDLGPCPPHSVDLVVLIDNSASVTSVGGTDPRAGRLAELRLAIRHMAKTCHCGHERISLISFDRPSRATVVQQRLSRTGVRRLNAGLDRMPAEPGSSELAPALSLAERIAANARGTVVVTVFSDFLLTDAAPGAVLNRFVALGDVRHAVVLGARPPSELNDRTDITVWQLSPTSSPGAVAEALAMSVVDARRVGDAASQECH